LVKLKPYKYIRPNTKEELEDETQEYFGNEYTKKVMPKLGKDKDDILSLMQLPNRIELLSHEELMSLQNSDVPELLSIDDARKRIMRMKELGDEYKKPWQSVLKGMTSLPPNKFAIPFVVKDSKENLYLFAGNTRFMVAISLGYNLPVKVLPYKFEFETEGLSTLGSQNVAAGSLYRW
tara:strand:+ start:590 stop:1123 length:534 start_codon:yes stop_codon:yes gene_type:complete